MRYRSLLLSLFLFFVVPWQETPAHAAIASQDAPTPSPTVSHRKPAKAKSDAKVKAQPSPTPDANEEMAARIGKVIGFLLFLALYFLPWIVAASRHHRNRTAIAVANFFLGWTCAGWVAILIWASTADVEPKRQAAAK